MIPFTEPGYDLQVDAGWHLKDYISLLRARFFTFLLIFLAVVVTVGVVFLSKTPMYKAESLLLVVDSPSSRVDFREERFDRSSGFEGYGRVSRFRALLDSKPVCEKVVERLGLHRRPPIPSPLDKILAKLRGQEAPKPETLRTPEEEKAWELWQISSRANLLKRSFKSEDRSNGEMLLVSLTDSDHEMVHLIVNEAVRVLKSTAVDFNRQSFANAQLSLNKRIEELQQTLQDAEREWRDYLQEHQAVELDKQMEAYTHQLTTELEGSRSEVELELVQLKARSAQGITSMEEKIALVGLEAKYTEIERKQASLTSRLKDLIIIRSESEVLERKVESWRKIYDLFMLKQKESVINELMVVSDIAVVEEAERPNGSEGPNPYKFIVFGIAFGLASGMFVVVFAEYMDSSLKGADEIRRALSVPVLCSLPFDRRRKKSDPSLSLVTLEEPLSPFAEVFRSLHVSIPEHGFHDIGGPRSSKIIQVSSPSKGDGKSTVSLNLAICLTQSGARTLLIESDFKRPSISSLFKFERENGLSTFDHENPEKFIRRGLLAGLDIIPAGKPIENPGAYLATLLSRPTFRSFLQGYDKIVFDSPPTAISDTLVVARFVRCVIYVVAAGSTSRALLTGSVRQLQGVGASISGVFVNFVPPSDADSQRIYQLYSEYVGQQKRPET